MKNYIFYPEKIKSTFLHDLVDNTHKKKHLSPLFVLITNFFKNLIYSRSQKLDSFLNCAPSSLFVLSHYVSNDLKAVARATINILHCTIQCSVPCLKLKIWKEIKGGFLIWEGGNIFITLLKDRIVPEIKELQPDNLSLSH